MLVGMHDQSLRLVDNQEIFVLKDDVQTRRGVGKLVFVGRLDEEFVLKPYVK